MHITRFRAAVGAAVTVAATAALLPTSAAFAAGKPDSRTADSATVEAFGRIADAILKDRTSVLLDTRSTADRKATRLDGKVRLSSGLSRAEDTGLSSLKTRKEWLAALGEAYTAAETRTSVDKATVKGNRATVRVTETTELTYKKIRGDEPSTTGFTAHHELSFSLGRGGNWELTGIRPQDDGPGAINEPRTAVAATGSIDLNGSPASTRYPGSRNAKPKNLTPANGGLDYKAMAAYAEKYWRNYNPAYRSFNVAGGDCTNFISQSLKAGGWKDVPGSDTSDYRKWWYNKSSQSDSWVGANEWAWHTLSTKRATNLSNVYQMDVGDILQMDFDGDGSKDHSMITTYRSRMGVPYVTYHSTNTYRKSVASIIASYPGAVYYAYRT
ncbi:hypothetical protein B7P34_24220 [Streptosporangium nondiastaticum]|uniref:Putative amidase domain-containing protein n=1 Tax=Streptosporangium nondiastaticum TaxID=35764 RepID=A0A9X7JM17_9ACTN|nr:hypothetical protein B7P34_24220 [Streptosporangium nondiastaticum]